PATSAKGLVDRQRNRFLEELDRAVCEGEVGAPAMATAEGVEHEVRGAVIASPRTVGIGVVDRDHGASQAVGEAVVAGPPASGTVIADGHQGPKTAAVRVPDGVMVIALAKQDGVAHPVGHLGRPDGLLRVGVIHENEDAVVVGYTRRPWVKSLGAVAAEVAGDTVPAVGITGADSSPIIAQMGRVRDGIISRTNQDF